MKEKIQSLTKLLRATKKPLPSIIVESWAHLGLNIDLGEGESILKESLNDRSNKF